MSVAIEERIEPKVKAEPNQPKETIDPEELALKKLGIKIDRIGMRGLRRRTA